MQQMIWKSSNVARNCVRWPSFNSKIIVILNLQSNNKWLLLNSIVLDIHFINTNLWKRINICTTNIHNSWIITQSKHVLIFISMHEITNAPSVRLSICPSVHLSICPSVHLSICPSVHLSICPSVHLSICPSVHLSICPSVHLSICPSVHLSICPSVHLSICPSVHLSICPSVHLSIWPTEDHASITFNYNYWNLAMFWWKCFSKNSKIIKW